MSPLKSPPPSRLPAHRPRFFTVAEVGIILRLSPHQVEELIAQKALPAIRSGTDGQGFRVRWEDLETYIQRRSRVKSE